MNYCIVNDLKELSMKHIKF